MSTSETRPSPSHSAHMPPVIVISRGSVSERPLLERDLAADGPRRDVEAERARRTDVRLPEAAEDDAEHVVGVGRRADGRARVGAHPLLVDDDRRGQVLERVDVRPGLAAHEALHERGVRLVDEAPRLRRDRLEHERALPRAGHAGEDGQPPLRDVEADVAEVVLARTADLDRAPVGGWIAVRHVIPHRLDFAASIRSRRDGPRQARRRDDAQIWGFPWEYRSTRLLIGLPRECPPADRVGPGVRVNPEVTPSTRPRRGMPRPAAIAASHAAPQYVPARQRRPGGSRSLLRPARSFRSSATSPSTRASARTRRSCAARRRSSAATSRSRRAPRRARSSS